MELQKCLHNCLLVGSFYNLFAMSNPSQTGAPSERGVENKNKGVKKTLSGKLASFMGRRSSIGKSSPAPAPAAPAGEGATNENGERLIGTPLNSGTHWDVHIHHGHNPVHMWQTVLPRLVRPVRGCRYLLLSCFPCTIFARHHMSCVPIMQWLMRRQKSSLAAYHRAR